MTAQARGVLEPLPFSVPNAKIPKVNKIHPCWPLTTTAVPHNLHLKTKTQIQALIWKVSGFNQTVLSTTQLLLGKTQRRRRETKTNKKIKAASLCEGFAFWMCIAKVHREGKNSSLKVIFFFPLGLVCSSLLCPRARKLASPFILSRPFSRSRLLLLFDGLWGKEGTTRTLNRLVQMNWLFSNMERKIDSSYSVRLMCRLCRFV